MKIRLRDFFAPGLALGGLALLLGPAASSEAFTIFDAAGLNLNQRDYRLHNIFADNQANNNNQPSAMYPGAFGADMALWKAAVEWGSTLHGDGSGDSGNPDGIGSGGADFDFYYAGEATSGGTSNNNIISVIPSCGGGTLAFVEGPINNGWRMTFCDEHTWSDGPGNAGNGQFNIQGVGLHEFGHSLGLGHSGANAVMTPATPNGNVRSILQDDMNGVQFIYGVASASKPVITDVQIDHGAGTLTITGTNFDTSDNDVWFTRAAATSSGSNPRLQVTGVPSSAGGTQITLSYPAAAGSGDVLVRIPGTEGRHLSNAYPADIEDVGIGVDLAINTVSPLFVESLIPGTDETVTLTGENFPATGLTVMVDAIPVFNFTRVNSTTLTLDMPDQLSSGIHVITLTDTAESQSDSINISVVPPATPKLQVGTGDPLNQVPTFLGALTQMAGGFSEFQWLGASSSPVPSVIPGSINLSMGNVFTEIFEIGIIQMNAQGQFQTSLGLSGLAGQTLYFQSLKIPLPFQFPLPESNLQSIVVF